MAVRIQARRRYLNKTRGGFTQEAMARMLAEKRGVPLSREAYSKYEQADADARNEVAASDMAFLAEILEVEVGYFYGDQSEADLMEDDAVNLYLSLPSDTKRQALAVLHALAPPPGGDEK